MENSIQSSVATRSLDHLIRLVDYRLPNGQADLLRGLQVDDQLELHRLLHRQVSRLGAFQYFVHVESDTPVQIVKIGSISHDPPSSAFCGVAPITGSRLLAAKSKIRFR